MYEIRSRLRSMLRSVIRSGLRSGLRSGVRSMPRSGVRSGVRSGIRSGRFKMQCLKRQIRLNTWSSCFRVTRRRVDRRQIWVVVAHIPHYVEMERVNEAYSEIRIQLCREARRLIQE